MSPRVVFFGTEQFSAPTLRALISAGYDIAYVVTKPDTQRGRGQALTSPEVKIIAEQHGIAVLQPQKLAEIYDTLAQLQKPLGVLVAYGKIIPQRIIDLFTPGIINVHPSLLPLYRGPSPIEAAILHGDMETGITIMQLSADMDTGPIYVQERIPLNRTETKTDLYRTFSARGATLLIDSLPRVIHDDLGPEPQEDEHASYCSLLKKSDGLMNLNTKSAHDLEREVRAYLGFPKSRLVIADTPVIITRAHVGSKDEPLAIACALDSYLVIDELIAPSGKKMNASAFIRGYVK